MDTLRGFLGASHAKDLPTVIESDEIYPVHMLDDTKTLRGIVVTWTLQFNDVLDADKLYMSLSKLLEIGDWRKVGGRLRLNTNGELEIHVPRPFTVDRPSVSFSRQSFNMNIEDHPLAKTLPKATERPSIQAGPGGFRAFAAREDAPATLHDFISQDIPQLSLHITAFNDATLVALSWPHTLMDVMGQQALLRSWSLVLAGRESEVPPMLGAQQDVLCAAADDHSKSAEPFKLGEKQLEGWTMLKFGLRFAWDLMWNRVIETRTIFLPKGAVAQLQRRAQDDLVDKTSVKEVPFVSVGDVLTAWATRAVALSLPDPRPVTVIHALNARFRLSSLIQSSGVYIQNMAVGAFTFLSPERATGSLGQIALENRRYLTEQSTEEQVLAFLRYLQGLPKADSDPSMVCGESDAVLVPFTNWTKANFFKTIDFSPAVLQAGETGVSRINPPGTVVYHHSQAMQPSAMTRNVFVVLGKDHGDNYWLTGFLSPEGWAQIEKEMKELS